MRAWPPTEIKHSLPAPSSTSPQYQAHAGLNAVVVDAWDHLQGDGVLTWFHVIHLRSPVGRLAGPQTSLPNYRHREGEEMPGEARDRA